MEDRRKLLNKPVGVWLKLPISTRCTKYLLTNWLVMGAGVEEHYSVYNRWLEKASVQAERQAFTVASSRTLIILWTGGRNGYSWADLLFQTLSTLTPPHPWKEMHKFSCVYKPAQVQSFYCLWQDCSQYTVDMWFLQHHRSIYYGTAPKFLHAYTRCLLCLGSESVAALLDEANGCHF